MRLFNRNRIVAGLVVAGLLAGWARSSSLAGGFAPNQAGGDAGDPQGGEPKTVYVSLPMGPEAAASWRMLQGKVPMHFPAATPFEEVLKFVKEATKGDAAGSTGLQVYVDPIALGEADKTMQSPVSIDLEGLPLSTTLDLILTQLGLGFVVQKDGLVVVRMRSEHNEGIDPTLMILNRVDALTSEVRELRAELRRGRMHAGIGGGMGGMGGTINGATATAGGGMR